MKKLLNTPLWLCSNNSCEAKWLTYEKDLKCPHCHFHKGKKTNITYEEMASLRSENIQLGRRKFPLLTLGHLKQLNDQTVITTRRLLTESHFSHLTNQQITNILLCIYPADRPIPRNQIRQLSEIYHLKTEDVKYIHLLVGRWLPYYQIET